MAEFIKGGSVSLSFDYSRVRDAPSSEIHSFAHLSMTKNPQHSFPTADPKVGWGQFQPGDRITDISELKQGDFFLGKTNHLVSQDRDEWAHNVFEVLQVDPHGLGAKQIYVRMVAPYCPSERRIGSHSPICFWDFEFEAGTQDNSKLYFRTELPAALMSKPAGKQYVRRVSDEVGQIALGIA